MCKFSSFNNLSYRNSLMGSNFYNCRCDLCGKGFVKAYKMRLHRVTHEKRGPYKPVELDGERQEHIKDDMSEIVIGIMPSS